MRQGSGNALLVEFGGVQILTPTGKETKGYQGAGVVMAAADEAAPGVLQLGRRAGAGGVAGYLPDLVAEDPGMAGLDAFVFVFVQGDADHY